VATIVTTRNTGLDAVADVLDACGYSGRVVGAAEAHALTAPGQALFLLACAYASPRRP